MITPEIGRKHAQHALRIEAVRFSPSGAAVDENACGFKNMADDAMCRQQTVQPEAVTSRLKAADNAYRRVEPASSTGRQSLDQSQQGSRQHNARSKNVDSKLQDRYRLATARDFYHECSRSIDRWNFHGMSYRRLALNILALT